jgi:acyl-CoA dehydrogenase
MVDFELTDRERQIKEMAHQFAKFALRPIALEADRLHRMPDDFLQRLSMMRGMLPGQGADAGGIVEEDEDGKPAKGKKKFSSRLAMIGAEELAWGDASILLCLPGPGLGGPPVRFMGTKEQKERFFGVFKQPGLHYGAYGLTEPGAGSDVSGIKSTCKKVGGDWVINGRKCFITNGARADWVVIFATVDATQGRAGHRAFVVEKGTPGFSVGKIEEKMGLRASETAELVLEDVRVPAENLLGGDEHYEQKEGFMGAMKTFDASRPMVGIMAVGIARAAYEALRDHVKEKYVLSRPIPRYAQIAARLGDMAREIDAARLMCWRAAWLQDAQIGNAKEASMAKAYAAKVAQGICRDAVQLMGADGLERSALVEKWYRDIKVFDIFEGTAQIQRIVIARRILKESPSW